MAAMRQARMVVLLAMLPLGSLLVATRRAAATAPQNASPVYSTRSAKSASCATAEETNATLARTGSLLEQSRYRDASALLQPLIAGKCDPRIALLLAAAYEGDGDAHKSEETLAAAHIVWPANTSISASLAREYLASGRPEKAVVTLAGFHATDKTPLQELQVAASVFLAGSHLLEAQAVAEAAYKGYPSLATLLLLANVMQLEGRYKEVNRLLSTQRQNYADSPAFLITAAESESDAMVYDKARADLERAVALDGRSYQAHYLLGTVLSAENETSRAEAEYRTAMQLAPDQPRTYYQLALLLRNRQDIADEEPLLAQALAADDRYAPAYCERGRILLDQQRIPEAVTQLNLAIQYNPRLEQAYYLLGRAYTRLGQKDKADATVKQFIALRAANRKSIADSRPGQTGVAVEAQP